MRKKHNSFVVFLDVDGVLNTKTTVQHTPDGYTGIDDARVEILANTINNFGGADIVLSSDWKNMKQTDEDYIYLLTNGIEKPQFAAKTPAVEAIIFMDYLKLY